MMGAEVQAQSPLRFIIIHEFPVSAGRPIPATYHGNNQGVHKNESFENQTVILDGNEFAHCEMRRCNLVYKGREPVKLEHCQLAGCTWQFEDSAQRTVMMLKGLYLNGHVGKEIVDAIFRSV